jgi:hypothetical protein
MNFMKKVLLSIVLLLSVANLQAQSISLHTWGAASVGEILAASGDTFTSRHGVWIYTWSKEGKKISTRAAK